MIPIAKPLLGAAEADAAREVVLSGWLSQGVEVENFEHAFADVVGASHACAVSNCTSALKLALEAVGIRRGDEVVTVSHSFVAAANAIRSCGGEPVFVDIEPETFNLDPRGLEAAITARTRAILCVHQMGMPCDLSEILAIASAHGLPVIEDAACAAGSEIAVESRLERIGKPHGDIACFSFHPRKVVTTGEGGMLTTRNPEWDRLFRLRRQHGMDASDTVRHSAASVVFERYPVVGFNYRMTDIQAAVGRRQLERLGELVARRRYLAERYVSLLAETPRLLPPHEPRWARSNWQSYCVRLPDDADQCKVMQTMIDHGISTRRGIMCAHREAPYAKSQRAPLPRSEEAQDRCILLPLYAQMTDEDQNKVVVALKAACTR